MKKVTSGDIGTGWSKIWYFRGDVIFEWPQYKMAKLALYFKSWVK